MKIVKIIFGILSSLVVLNTLFNFLIGNTGARETRVDETLVATGVQIFIIIIFTVLAYFLFKSAFGKK